MKKVPNLVPILSLKTNYLTAPLDTFHQVGFIRRADIFIVDFVRPATATVVQYKGNNIGFTYEQGTREIVGFMIPSFQKKFLPLHPSVNELWKSKDIVDSDIKDFGDISRIFYTHQRRLVKEIINVLEQDLDPFSQPFKTIVS